MSQNFVSNDDAVAIVTEIASKLGSKQDTLSFDNTPTQNSDNPVKSGGVYTALASKANTSDIGTAAAKNFTTSVTSGSNDLVTSGAVYAAIDNLPEPMVFKGSLGTGGTITALPVNGTATVGDTYKVITAGTYASKEAKVGDTFICLTKTSSANTWELIPSGDEPSGTVTSVTIKATSPISIDSSSAITTSGTRTLSHANSGATAGSYGDSGNQTPGYGSTFKVPYVTVNATGHVTGISEHTVKIPASDNTNTTYAAGTGITISGTNNAINVTYGSAANTACQGNDSRLSNARQVADNVLTNQDLNSVMTPGFYSAGGGNSVSNKPSGVDHFGLIVIHGASGQHYIQMIYAPNLSKSYRRFCTGGTSSWSSWTEEKITDNNTTYNLTNNGSSVRLTGSDSTNKDVTMDTLLSNLPGWTATATDDTYFIRRDTGGTAAFGQVKFSTLWSYIKGKTDSAYAAASHTHNYAGSSSAGGAATSAAKLSTARSIALGGDFVGSANFDGSANITINGYNYNCSVNGGNKANYPWHRIAYCSGKTGQYVDLDAIFAIRRSYDGGDFGLIKVSLRTNSSGSACSINARWLYRCGFAASDVVIAHWGTTGQSVYADIFLKCGTYPRTVVYQVEGARTWTLVNSTEVNDTTSSDKKTSTECYVSVASAATEIHNQAYTSTKNAVDAGTVNYANNSGTVNGKTVAVNVPADAKFTDTKYTASTTSIGSASAGTAIAADDITAWSAGSVPSLTITSTACDDITAWSAGTMTSASYSKGVLTITNGSAPSLSYTARSVGSASGWSAGTLPSLSYTARSIPNISVSSKTVVTGITAG